MSIQIWTFQLNSFSLLGLHLIQCSLQSSASKNDKCFSQLASGTTIDNNENFFFTYHWSTNRTTFFFFFKARLQKVLPKYQNWILLSVHKCINTNGKLQLPISVGCHYFCDSSYLVNGNLRSLFSASWKITSWRFEVLLCRL